MAGLGKGQPPFYEKVTLLTERFMRDGIPDNEDLALVTLPPGTVLFRGLKIPNQAAGVDPRIFYRDFPTHSFTPSPMWRLERTKLARTST